MEGNLHEEHERFHFNAKFLQRFWNLLKTIFPRWNSVTTWLFIGLLCTVLLEQVIIYNVGLIPSKFYKCLGDKDRDAFQALMLHAIGLVMAVAFVMATDKYICNVFYVTSRSIVTRHLHTEYFKDIHYYQLNVLDDTIDNPDQRITQDVDRTCNKLSEIVARLLISPFTIAYYVYQTWTRIYGCKMDVRKPLKKNNKIKQSCVPDCNTPGYVTDNGKTVTGRIHIFFHGCTGYLGPLCVVGFFLMSTFINKLLMSPVVALVYRQERLEGDFRFKHMQVRSNAESAAFYRCGRMERDKADARLDKLVNTQQKLVLREYFLSFSIQCADYLGSILSYVILAIPIFLGKYDDMTPAELSALISKNAFVTIYLISCFTRLIDMASQVTDLAGTTHRIGQLMDELSSLEEVSQHHRPPTNDIMNTAVPSIQTTYMAQGKVAFSLEGVSYTPPGSDRMLVKDLTWQLAKGMNVLVTGDSGCGKTSLLRVLDGLWNTICSGTIDRPIPHARNGVLYLPQKPFFSDGTLRQQITYPYKEYEPSRMEDHDVIKLLQEADLMSLYDRLGGLDVPIDWNWFDMLSPGEMQRLAFVRLFYYKPPFAVLDEATSQLGLDMEHKLYTKCHDLEITLLSVGHRDTLRQFHHVQLRLYGQDGAWSLEEIHLPK